MTEQPPPTPQPAEQGTERIERTEPPAAPSPAAPSPSQAAPSPTPAAPGPYAYPPGPTHPAGPYGDPAFLAPPRPRVLWVNPQRRMHVAGAGLAIALVCGGAGVAIGWAASDHHERGPIGVRLGPANHGRYLPGPDRMGPNRLPRPAAPTPAPTSTH